MRRAIFLLALLLTAIGYQLSAFGQKEADSRQPMADSRTPTAEEEREQQIADRFLTVLEKNPRRGTALDRVYGFHVERGTLEQFLKKYRDRTTKDAKDGTAWLILGLVEAQRGKDAAAVTAFKDAEKHLAENPLPAYYLGQSLVLVGQPDLAAEAFERALTKKPARADLLEIFQALGRVYQRAQKTDKALEVWNRLEKLFPDDGRVQEQIAVTLAEEGQFEQALNRYEALTKTTKDDYRKSLMVIESAGLKVRLNRTPQALGDFEKLLGQLNPDSWLHREVRRKIEEVFLRGDDQAGLAKYYEAWIGKNPEDVDAMARLARTLASQGRVPEAQGWLDKALKVAPKRKELRLAFIDQLVYDQKFADAVAQYEALDKTEPNNPDYLREWGKLILKDKARPEADRKQAAGDVWKKLTTAKPKDPVIAVQVADLFRQSEMSDQALDFYKKAVELAPKDAQYREYLGEFYHSQKKSDEALATWREIAAGDNRTAKSLARLAEVLAGFGYLKEAVTTTAEACGIDKDDFALQLRYAELLHQSERYDDALKQLDVVQRLAQSEDEKETLLQGFIKTYQAQDTLNAQIEKLEKELKAGTDATARRWFVLARYLEANRQITEATEAIKKTLSLDEQFIPALAAAARVYESGGNLLAASDMYRKLSVIDRRFRTEYLTNVAKLEARLGRREPALQAARDLLAAAPGNPDNYKFYAELCFQLGETDEGLDALRRSVRVNPAEPQVVQSLAQALADRFRTDEAIELYWRAFEKTAELEGKLSVVQRLTELYLQTNHFDRLVERLERERREAEKQREMTICLAQAFQSAGDYGTARQELERLLNQNARDTQLLTQLSNLSESEGDLAAAVKFQQQLNSVAPTKEGEVRLAQLMLKSGETEEAMGIWLKLTLGEQELHRILQAIDSLLGAQKFETVLTITDRMLRDHPKDWELLYREGVALVGTEKPAEALKRFNAILDQTIPDDEKSAIAKAKAKQGPKPGSTAAKAGPAPATVGTAASGVNQIPLQTRAGAVYQIRSAVGLEVRDYYGGGMGVWTPGDFGQARMGAQGWLLGLATKENKAEEVVKRFRDAKSKPNADSKSQWDWYYLTVVRNEYKERYEASKALSEGGDLTAKWAYLTNLSIRHIGNPNVQARRPQDTQDTTPPLPDAELEHMMKCYRLIHQQKPEWLGSVLTGVVTELKRSKRDAEGQELYRQAIDSIDNVDVIVGILSLAGTRGDMESIFKLLAKLEKLQVGQSSQRYVQVVPANLARAMAVRAEEKAHADVLRMLDHYLAFQKRQKQNAVPGKAAKVYNPYGPGRNYVQVYSTKTTRGINIDFPMPNEYLDHGGILILRNAFEIYRKDDLTTDLLAHFRKQLDAAAGPDKVFAHLVLCYLNWWNEEKEGAAHDMAKACEAAPADYGLRLELAALRERLGEPDEALGIIDSITPLDHTTMQKCEQTALRLATLTGNLDRARQACDRLFGLRLDADTQVNLSSQMRQLGLHEQAEAVLARARRQAGNKTSALSSLMLQYQAQNKPEVAMQVAYQILRKGPSLGSMNRGGASEDDAYRTQAIQVLARSGKLQEMITRAEAQLKNSPRSVQIHQTLAEYQQAAGNKEKVNELYQKMIELRPEDGKLRFRVANQLAQAGQIDQSLDHYRVAFKKEPALFVNSYWEVMQRFQQAGKLEELGKLFDDIDFRQFGNYYWLAGEMVNMLSQDEKTRPLAMKLFGKAWKAFPTQRSYMLSQIYQEEMWQLPEIYDFLRQGVIPGVDGDGRIEGWAGLDQITNWNDGGKVDGVVTRLLTQATRANRIDQLTKDVEDGLKKQPDWSGGRGILALLRLRRGNTEETRKLLEELLADTKTPFPVYARWMIAQELENYGSLEDLALKIYEGSVEESMKEGNIQFAYSPVKRLVTLYQQAGRKDDARNLLLKYSKPRQDSQGYPADYLIYRRMEDLAAIGDTLLQHEHVVDAMRMYNEILSDPAALEGASRYYGGGSNYFQQRVQGGLERALSGLKPEILGPALKELLRGNPDAKKQAKLDLMLTVQPRELDRAALFSMLARAISGTSGKPELQGQVRAALDDLVKDQPREFSVQVTAALAALAENKPEALKNTVARLETLLSEVPLEDLPAKTKANARQRAEAAQQMGLWLAARECLKKPELKEVGAKLGERALEAARRQTDQAFVLAILREWGQIAFDQGDKTAAEAKWSQMLDIVLGAQAPPKPKNTGMLQLPQMITAIALTGLPRVKQAPAPKVPTAVVPVPRAPVSAAPVRGGNAVPVVTFDQFQRASQIAKLAAERDLHALSHRAIRESLRGGPPVQITNPDARQQRVVFTSGGSMVMSGDQSQMNQQVYQQLTQLEALWRRRKAPAADVYETLALALFPEARPAEVFSYPQPLANSGNATPMSLGSSLIEWAVKAKKIDDLKARLAKRQSQPLGELHAQVMLAQIGLANAEPQLTTQALTQIAERLKKDTLQNTAEHACHAALPALKRPEHAAQAVALIEAALRNMAVTQGEEPVGSLRLTLARHYYQTGNAAEGKKRIQEFLAGVEQSTIRYGGDYGVYQRKNHIQRAAQECAQAGQLADALDLLGQFADLPRYSGGDPAIQGVAASLARQLAAVPTAERYQMLKTWTLPSAGRKSVRMIESLVPNDLPPKAFGNIDSVARDGVFSTALALIDAAQAAGTLDQLEAEAAAADGQKVEQAGLFLALIQATRGVIGPDAVMQLLEELRKKEKKVQANMRRGRGEVVDQQELRQVFGLEYLLGRACLNHPTLREKGREILEDLLDQAKKQQQHAMLTRLRQDLARGEIAQEKDARTAPGRDPGFALWQPVEHVSSWTLQSGTSPTWWLAHDGMVSHLGGAESDSLYLDVPLTGSFEFSVDAFHGGWAEGNIGYGGLVFDALHLGQYGSVWPVGHHETLVRQHQHARADRFNRLTLQVEPGKVRLLVNGRLFHEDTDIGPTSPWLSLVTSRERQTWFRNFRLTGKPQIPREVALVSGDHLEGWMSGFYNESQPARRSEVQQHQQDYEEQIAFSGGSTRYTTGGMGRTEQHKPEDHDWHAKDGVLHGKRYDGGRFDGGRVQEAMSSRLTYHRPLRDGDTLRYEFFWDGDNFQVHPALDRLAFLLEPDGVKAHWLIAGGDPEWTGLKADNAVVEPGCRRGPERLPLKSGEWNALKLSIAKGILTLDLNGTTIYERPMEPSNDRLFSLFRYRDRHACQVRNVVLSGDWPEELTPRQFDTLLARSQRTPADERAERLLVSEQAVAAAVPNLLESTRSLNPSARYELLKRWVLPQDELGNCRLYAQWTATDPVQSVQPAPQQGKRLHVAPQLQAPALDLVAAAKETGKLDDLHASVQKLSAGDDHQRRCRLALLAMVQSAQGRDDAAAGTLGELFSLLEKLPERTPEWQRWPELMAASQAIERPALRDAGLKLLDHIVVSQMQKHETKMPKRDGWERQVRHLRGRGQVLALNQAFGVDPGLAHWSPVTLATAASRGTGDPLPHWTLTNGELRHYPGHGHDDLYCNVPMRGDFELSCELTSFGWREAQIGYGGLRYTLHWDLKKLNLEQFHRHVRNIPLDPPIEKLGDWYEFKLVVQKSVCSVFINGRRVAEERLHAECDPWLMIHQRAGLAGGVRNLKITGQPMVPEKLNLLAVSDLTGWLGDYYAQAAHGQGAPWQRRGEEIYGVGGRHEPTQNPNEYGPGGPEPRRPPVKQPLTWTESVLQYHRPLLEDGELEYEFFFEPKKTMVHPALDRLALLLDPDGVKLHWLTDAQHDRSALTPDNVTEEKRNRRGPEKLSLKEKDWNKVKLVLKGDRVTLFLNDVEIYQRDLEATNQRNFGLFHWSDQTDVRVRRVSYRGDWAKQFPSAAELLRAAKP